MKLIFPRPMLAPPGFDQLLPDDPWFLALKEWAVTQNFKPDVVNNPFQLHADAMSYIAHRAPGAQPPWGSKPGIDLPGVLEFVRHVGGALQGDTYRLDPEMARRMKYDNSELFEWLRSVNFALRIKLAADDTERVKKTLHDLGHVLQTAFTDNERKQWEDEAKRALGLP